MKSRNRTLFDGISGYVARSPDRARLVIGPFRANSDAEIFQEDLQSVGIDAFSWTNSESDRIVPLGTE
jgi:cell division protein FtsN